ncbi:MAG: hypothetical protein ACI4MJ_12690, partial [Aristaeellaceae bacterium]
NKKATPVFITPLTRYGGDPADDMYNHVRWADAMRRTAKELDVALIDLTAMSKALVAEKGEEARTAYYMNLPAGVYPHFPNGQKDNSHLQPAGALAFAGLIAKALHELGGKYAALLTDGYDQWQQETAHFGLADSAAQEVEL